MKSPRNSSFSWLLIASICVGTPPAFGWGQKGHRLVNSTAADLMTSPAAGFFQKNKASLALLATTPDLKWKAPATYNYERATHFFQWDRYSKTDLAGAFDRYLLTDVIRKLGKEYLSENGTANWRISSFYKKMVDALKERDWVKAVQMAGVMGHYVGDLSQPMHVTSDYDGQSINRRGVHKYFETTLVDRSDQGKLGDSILEDGASRRQDLDQKPDPAGTTHEMNAITIEEGQKSYEELEDVLSQFDGQSQDDRALTGYLSPRMGDGAAVLAKIWDLAIEESGVKRGFPARALTVPEPAWIPLEGMSVDVVTR